MMMTDTNIRIENAYNGLVEILTEYGAGERANEVADFYIERGLVELDEHRPLPIPARRSDGAHLHRGRYRNH